MSLWTAIVYAVGFGGPVLFWLTVPSWMPKWMEAWSVLVFLVGYFALAAIMFCGNRLWHRHYDR